MRGLNGCRTIALLPSCDSQLPHPVSRHNDKQQSNHRGDYTCCRQSEPPAKTLSEVVAEAWEGRSTLDARWCTGKRDATTWAVTIIWPDTSPARRTNLILGHWYSPSFDPSDVKCARVLALWPESRAVSPVFRPTSLNRSRSSRRAARRTACQRPQSTRTRWSPGTWCSSHGAAP
jgi:hypothetical protein